jgi:hypothetical protein
MCTLVLVLVRAVGVALTGNKVLLPHIQGVSILGGSTPLPRSIVDVLILILVGNRLLLLHTLDLVLDSVFACILGIVGRRILFLSLGRRSGHCGGGENGDGDDGGDHGAFCCLHVDLYFSSV